MDGNVGASSVPNNGRNIAEAARRTELDPVGGGGPNRAYRSNFQGSTGERVEAGRHAADHEWIRDTLRLRHAFSRTPPPS